MYTRCPGCQTIFNLTSAQLAARQGKVRCGHCDKVFQADRHLLKTLPRAPGKTAAKLKPATRPERARRPEAIPLISELMFPEAPRAARNGFWIAGSTLLLLTMLGQWLFFYPGDVAPPDAPWRPWVTQLCETLGCDLGPRHRVHLIELVETQVAPHPQYDKALRIRATLVNRAGEAQPYPLMEVSLTNTNGLTVARRSFAPAEYLENSAQARDGMPSHVAVTAQLDITHPDRRALGYEIQLLPMQ
jgi:predicted Zn finger-like uncharacterized protein